LFFTFKLLFIFSVILGLVFFKAPVNINLLESSLVGFQTWNHPLGCDRLGRDIYALYAYGTFTTFLISIPARAITLFVSVCVSFLSYSTNKYINFIIDSVASAFLSLPSFLVAIIVLYSLGSELFVFYIAIVISDWAFAYESIQGKVREVKESGFVIAARTMGANKYYLFKMHIFPEIVSMLFILFVTGIPGVIMTVAIFSYMGIDFGTEFLGPGLGEQIAFSKDYFLVSPISLFTPILGILFLVLSLGKKFRITTDEHG
jgi:peptide/nickel transport system permease protein